MALVWIGIDGVLSRMRWIASRVLRSGYGDFLWREATVRSIMEHQCEGSLTHDNRRT